MMKFFFFFTRRYDLPLGPLKPIGSDIAFYENDQSLTPT